MHVSVAGESLFVCLFGGKKEGRGSPVGVRVRYLCGFCVMRVGGNIVAFWLPFSISPFYCNVDDVTKSQKQENYTDCRIPAI